MDERKFFIASVNDDGTYGEPVEITGEITPDLATEPDTTATNIHMFEGGEITGTFEVPRELAEQLEICAWYQRKSAEKGCFTCRKCKEMYRYPGFVTAETCECIDGLECDTYLDRVKNCPNYEYRPYNEPQLRNPDLDNPDYMYVIK